MDSELEVIDTSVPTKPPSQKLITGLLPGAPQPAELDLIRRWPTR